MGPPDPRPRSATLKFVSRTTRRPFEGHPLVVLTDVFVTGKRLTDLLVDFAFYDVEQNRDGGGYREDIEETGTTVLSVSRCLIFVCTNYPVMFLRFETLPGSSGTSQAPLALGEG